MSERLIFDLRRREYALSSSWGVDANDIFSMSEFISKRVRRKQPRNEAKIMRSLNRMKGVVAAGGLVWAHESVMYDSYWRGLRQALRPFRRGKDGLYYPARPWKYSKRLDQDVDRFVGWKGR